MKVLYKYNYLKEKNIGYNNYNGKSITRINISLIGLGIPSVNIITNPSSQKQPQIVEMVEMIEKRWCRIINKQVKDNQKRTAEINLIQLICRELKSKLNKDDKTL